MENMQTVVDQGPRTEQYFSDAFPVYESLVYYPGKYTAEWDNAELRHYLARLTRKPRCFSRCLRALCYALRLLIFAFSSRQLYKQEYPNYPTHVFEFVAP